jgi:hypothetical protein
MENTFVVNNEPITIKITIEIIPSKKKEDIKEVPVVVPVVKPEGWDAVEPEPVNPVPSVAPEPEKKKRARKPKITEEVVSSLEEKKVELPVEEKPTEVIPSKVEVKPTVVPDTPSVKPIASTNPNKIVARLAQMIRFYCKASNISTTEITKKYLVEHGAADIIEGATDEDIEEAFKEVVKK